MPRNMGATLALTAGGGAFAGGVGEALLPGVTGLAELAGALGSLGGFDLGLSIIQLQLVKLVVVKRILDRKILSFVQPKVTAAKWFCSFCPIPEAKAALFWLLNIVVIDILAGRPLPSRSNAIRASSAHAIVGATQLHSQRAVGSCPSPARRESRRLSPADACRGRQESNWFSFSLLINVSFQFGPDLLQPVTVAAGRRIR